ncbi:MAG: hypothetical protein DMD75_32200 [Candidatus Rokuibacteriota bacterium]|nr:MAG: hypothetical protein DMD75_32200 [Candidatus Rokubacteria bacterium]
MRYGFYLPTRGQTATPGALETLVKRGESLGFASVMIADHLVFPVSIKSRYPYTVSGDFPGQGDVLDQLSLMAFVAAKTTRLRLVTSVMIVPYRNPVLTAKALATIDAPGRGDRRVPPRLQDALDRESRVLLRAFLSLRRAPLSAPARSEAAPADLGGRPQQGRPATGGAPRRRLASGRRQRLGPAAAVGAVRIARRALSPHRGRGARPQGADDLVQGAGVRPRPAGARRTATVLG